MEVNILSTFVQHLKNVILQMNKKIFSFIFYKIDGASFLSFAIAMGGTLSKVNTIQTQLEF
jgi:hypothetical protein